MTYPQRMLLENLAWAEEVFRQDAHYFYRLTQTQQPKVLWIGCSDSRVPVENITGARPGEIFVHRNIANLVAAEDENLASVLEYAIVVLRVQHIIVCGHHCCGGVGAALRPPVAGIPRVNRRIEKIRTLSRAHAWELAGLADLDARTDRLAELSVAAQVRHLQEMPLVRDAPTPIQLHGWIFSMGRGRLEPVTPSVWSNDAQRADALCAVA